MSTNITVNELDAQPVSPRRGRFFRVRQALKWFGIILVAVLIFSIVLQEILTYFDRNGYQAPGQFYTVNGHRMHLYCTGGGEPTILLEAGAYSFSLEWYWIQEQLSADYRVCSYDRAGNGWSEPVEGARDGLTLVDELRALLAEADVSGPYVLAGHSLGGILNRIYAARHPDEVLGLVLVDSAVPRTWEDYAAYEEYRSQNESAYLLMSALTRTGIIRVILSREFLGYNYPAAVVDELTAFKSTNPAVDTWDAEVRLVQWDLGQQSAAAEDLGALPVITLWAGHPELTSPEDRARLQAIWDSVPAFSSNAVVRIVEGADHGSIQGNEQYAQQVSRAVRDVIESANTGSPLPS